MRNSSSLDWLRFMHTPNDYRVSPLEDLKRFAKEGIICKVGRGNQMLFVKNQEDSQTEQNI